jgi:hypothetical protein
MSLGISPVRRRRDSLEMPPASDRHGAYGRLPVMKEVKREAERRHIELVIVPTREAIRLIEKESAANAILHVTC